MPQVHKYPLPLLMTDAGHITWAVQLGEKVLAGVTVIHSVHPELMLVPTQSGKLIILSRSDGQVLLSLDLHSGPIARPPGWITESSQTSTLHVLQSTNSGRIFILKMISQGGIWDCSAQHVYQMPNDLFSPLLIWNHLLLIGCRDNHLHCLELEDTHMNSQ